MEAAAAPLHEKSNSDPAAPPRVALRPHTSAPPLQRPVSGTDVDSASCASAPACAGNRSRSEENIVDSAAAAVGGGGGGGGGSGGGSGADTDTIGRLPRLCSASVSNGSPATPSAAAAAMKKAVSHQNIGSVGQAVGGAGGPEALPENPAASRSRSAVVFNTELLANSERVKRELEARISHLARLAEERKFEVERSAFELKRQRAVESRAVELIAVLKEENAALKERLQELGGSTENFTDADKLLRKHGLVEEDNLVGAGGSSNDDGSSQDLASVQGECASIPPPPSEVTALQERIQSWEARSTKSSEGGLSEISVACLQERISRMQEDNYTTNEELQATLQELGDLQQSVNELTEENENLSHERTVLYETICAQSEKLDHCRMQIDHLKYLLMYDRSDRTDKEQELIAVLQATEAERNELTRDQATFVESLTSLEKEGRELRMENANLRDLRDQLRAHCDALEADNERLAHGGQTLEDKLKAVEDELAHCRLRAPSEGSGPVQEVLCRLEQLEGELRKAHDIKKQVIASFEEQLRQSAAQLQEAEAQLQETEAQLQDVSARCKALQEDAEARLSAELAEKAELQRQVASEQQQRARAEEKLAKEIAEWKLYESDLLRTVRVADSIKAESEEEAERLAKENEGLQDQVTALQADVANLKQSLATRASEARAAAGPQETSVSVRSLVQTIEAKGGPAKAGSPPQICPRPPLRSEESPPRRSSIAGEVAPPTPSTPPPSVAAMSAGGATLRPALRRRTPPSQALPQDPEGGASAEPKPRPGLTHRNTVAAAEAGSGGAPPNGGSTSAPLAPEPPRTSNTVSPVISLLLSTGHHMRRNSLTGGDGRAPVGRSANLADPLAELVKQTGGSKRNALLKWCQAKTAGYPQIEITNFSSSWNDGLALCALLHSYLPDKVPFRQLNPTDKRRNFQLAFEVAEAAGIATTLDINSMVNNERPDWNAVMTYVTAIYRHFEGAR